MRKFLLIISILLIISGCDTKETNDKKDIYTPSIGGKATIKEGYQEVVVNVKSYGYEDIIVQKGLPVKLILIATNNNLNGCNNGIIIKNWGVTKDLKVGNTIVEFTPTETGTFIYSCWMNMLQNKITVIDDLENNISLEEGNYDN